METEKINVEDLHPLLKEVQEEEPKAMKKFKVMAAKLVDKVNGRIEGERDILRKKISTGQDSIQKNIDKFCVDTNTNIEAFKKRYEAMYTHLVRDVMLKQEKRVFAAELFEQATLDLFVDKIFRFENKLGPDDEVDHIAYHAYIEECAAKHEGFMQKHANAFAKKQQDERNEAMALEEEKENQAKDTGGTEDSASGEANSEDSGASDSKDGGQAESNTSEG